MPKRIFLLLAMLIGLVTQAGLAASTPVSAAEVDDEARFVVLINDLRASLGLQPLSLHPELVVPSRDWAAQLAADGALSHAPDLSVGVTVNWTMLGENVGVAAEDQTDALFEAFVASPGHYENLVNPDFSFVGVGVIYDNDGRMWTTHRFMAVAAPTSTTTAPPATSPPTTAPPPAPPTAPPPTTPPAQITTTTTAVATTQPSPDVSFTDASELAPSVIVAVVNELALSGV